LKPFELADRTAGSNQLNFGNFVNNMKVHFHLGPNVLKSPCRMTV
jgi:hypothetical protein